MARCRCAAAPSLPPCSHPNPPLAATRGLWGAHNFFEFFVRTPARVWALQLAGALSNRTTLVVGSPAGAAGQKHWALVNECLPDKPGQPHAAALLICTHTRPSHPTGERLPQFAPILLKPFTPYEVVSFAEVGLPLPRLLQCRGDPGSQPQPSRSAALPRCSFLSATPPLMHRPQRRKGRASAASSVPTCVPGKWVTAQEPGVPRRLSCSTIWPRGSRPTHWALMAGPKCSRCGGM